MSVIIILVIVGIIVAGIFLLGFIWAVKSGQYDDMYSPSVRILFDDFNGTSDENSDESNKDSKETEKIENNTKF